MNCYAERMSRRLKIMEQPRYCNGFDVTLHPEVLEQPFLWRKSRSIFVNSMGDLFHELVPSLFINDVFATMAKTPWHKYQILTKRADRLAKLAPSLFWPKNVWMGVTVENKDYLERINFLRHVPSIVRFISFEPLLGPITHLDLTGIDWVIVGGESGPKARPIQPDWVKEIRNSCSEQHVPFFFKQWGGTRKWLNGRELEGRTWNEYPRYDTYDFPVQI
jgi:protein gp37